MDHKSIAKNIKAIREANGHSLQATADLLEIHVNTYRRIEDGSRELVCPHLFDFARIFNTTIEEVLLGYFPNEQACKDLGEAQARYNSYRKSDEQMFNLELSKRDALLQQKEQEIDHLKSLLEEKDKRIRDLLEIKEIQKEYLNLLNANTTKELP